MTEEELCSFVKSQVDERLKRYTEAAYKTKGAVSLFGLLVCELADQSMEKRIAAGIVYFNNVRYGQHGA